MFDPKAELLKFLDDNGVGPWVQGEYGATTSADAWADQYLDQAASVFAAEAADDAEALSQLRDELDSKPNRKSIAVTKVRELIDTE